ncbi:MAG: sulfatase-like hydrolase/transferase [Nitrospirae bacterium]|nr:sulfatase-like hydrolase/transferase [Nitrospirota bacterium]
MTFIGAIIIVFGILIGFRLTAFIISDRFGMLLLYPYETLLTVLCLSYNAKELFYAFFFCLSFFVLTIVFKRAKNFVYAATLVFFSFWFTYRLFNLLHLYYSGWYIEKDFFTNITKTTLGMLIDVKISIVLFMIALLLYITYLVLKMIDCSMYTWKRQFSVLMISVSTILLFFLAMDTLTFMCLYGSMCNVTPFKTGKRSLFDKDKVMNQTLKLPNIYPIIARLPEDVLLSSMYPARHVNNNGKYPRKLMPHTAKKLEAFGISFDTRRKYPLYKDHVFHDPFPYAKTSNHAIKPNVIMFLMESLSARLLGIYGNRYKNITPNIDLFASESLVVDHFYNSTSITVNGITASLCSHYPSADRMLGFVDDEFLCLPEVLRTAGYNNYTIINDASVRLSWLHDNVISFEPQMIKDSLKEGYNSSFKTVLSDKQVLRYLVSTLSERVVKEPFFEIVYTMDMHPPFKMSLDSSKYQDGKNTMLNLVFSLDEAFGDFWRYFKDSPYARNTIIILLADHAMYPGTEYHDSFYGTDGIGTFDEIPLIIYDPIHRLPQRLDITSTQVDLPPSLLHMLDMGVVNPFEGHTIFGQKGRARFKNILGYYSNTLFYVENGRKKSFYLDRDHCSKKEIGTDSKLNVCDYVDWIDYMSYLTTNKLIWTKKNPDTLLPWKK